MEGLQIWQNPKNKFHVVKLHYTADPLKNPRTSEGKEWYEKTRAGMPSLQWEQEMELNFSIYSGEGVFPKEFKPALHIKKIWYLPDRPLIRGWDFGRRRPAVVFAQVDLKGRLLIFQSILGEDIAIIQFAQQIIQKTKEWFPDIAEVRDYGDPAGNQVKDTSEKTTIQVLQTQKIYVKSKRSMPLQRIELISKKLSQLIEGEPALLVNEDCRDIIEGFQGGYRYPKSKMGTRENPADDGYYIHLFDALGYTVDNLFSIVDEKTRGNRTKAITAKNWKNYFTT